MADSNDATQPAFIEHRIPRDRGSVCVRDFGGAGPAFLLLHGFPDNSHIYDDLIPHLVAAGRRTVAIDFLGFGSSDKPAGGQYSFRQQLGDVEAVVEAMALEKVIPVGHDAGGPTAVNFALAHPDRTASVVLMNVFYGEAPGLRVPELIELFHISHSKRSSFTSSQALSSSPGCSSFNVSRCERASRRRKRFAISSCLVPSSTTTFGASRAQVQPSRR